MTIRKTCQWTVFLVAILAAGGWYAARYALDHKDRLALEGIREEVGRAMPGWGIAVGDARIDLGGHVWLKDISIAPDPKQPPLVTIPKCLVTLDVDLLLEEKQLLVRSVRIINPQVLVSRDSAGTWNWQQLELPAASDQTPEVTIEHGDLVFKLAAGEGVPETEVASRDVNLRLVPAGSRRYHVEGASELDGIGSLTFGGEIDLNSRAWRLAGRADQIDMSQGLLEKAAALSPDVGRTVAELSGTETLVPESAGAGGGPRGEMDGPPVQTVSLERSSVTGLLLPNLGLSASIGVDFDVSSDGTQTVPTYRVLAKVVDGTVGEPLSPVPLSNLQGELLVENGRLVVHQLSATGGASQLSVSGQVERSDGRTLRDFEISASNLLIDDELRHLLSPGAKRLFDKLNPAGLFTIRGRFRGDGVGAPQVRLDEFTALDCSLRHELFPYPVTGITGTIKQQDTTLLLDLTGFASQRPVAIAGTIENPGPEATATVDVVVDELPLDELFVSCIVDPRQQDARKAIEALNLSGTLNLRARLARQAGLNQPTLMGFDADLSQGTLNFNEFPYRLIGFSGHIHYNPWKERVWKFTRLHGRHGNSDFSGAATYDLRQPAGLLELTMDARNVPFDRDLHRATTTAEPSLQQAWVELNPTRGVARFDDVHVTWTPGHFPVIELPSVHVDDGTVTMPSFPFRWDNVTGDLSWKEGRVSIHHMTARHNETLLRMEGRSADAYFEVLPAGEAADWQLRLEDVKVRNLDPGSEFRQALTGDVAAALQQLDPRGPIDADVGLEMKGFPDAQGGPDVVTSHWQLTTRLTRDRLAVGVDLTDVTGSIAADVLWDGQQIDAAGRIDLAGARLLDMTLTDIHAPFRVDGYHMTVGSQSMLLTPQPGSPEPRVPLEEQLTAKLYDGTVEVNAEATIHPTTADQSVYRAGVEVKNADLQQWLQEWGHGGLNVSGTTRAHFNLHGRGDSELGLQGQDCWMQISDARLGELPIIAQMLAQMVAPQQRDKTAFRYAYLDFSIHDGVFDFGPTAGRAPADTRRIQLVGDALKMIGQGYVPFAPQIEPRMKLDFYSKSPPNMLSAIPIVGSLAKSMSDNWIHVRVTGSPSDPAIRTQTEVPIDNALRELFRGLETGLSPMVPPR